jgi:hypothetical protein
MSLWPTDLPELPDRENWSMMLPKNVVRTSMDAGPAKQRKRFTAGVHTITMAITVDGVQLAVFRSFWANDCGQGALPFTWVDPTDDSTQDFQFLATEPPQIVNIGGDWWRVSFRVEMLP